MAVRWQARAGNYAGYSGILAFKWTEKDERDAKSYEPPSYCDQQEFDRLVGSRERHTANCSKCGADFELPFKPRPDQPVYCRTCYTEKMRKNGPV